MIMKNKLMKGLVAGVLVTVTGLASAEPVALTDDQMDGVSAGALGLVDVGGLLGGVTGTVGGVLGTVTGVAAPAVGTVTGLVPSVLGTATSLVPNVNLQAGAVVTGGASLSVGL